MFTQQLNMLKITGWQLNMLKTTGSHLCSVPARGDEGVDRLCGAVAGIGCEPQPGRGAGAGGVQEDGSLHGWAGGSRSSE